MTRARVALAVALSALLGAPALATNEPANVQERRIDEPVTLPTPLGPALLLSDETRFALDIPAETVVLIDAVGSPTSLFYLHFHREDEAVSDLAFPATHQKLQLPGPSRWILHVDPAGSPDFHVALRFEGRVGDHEGAPAPFVLEDLGADRACVIAGVCLL